MANRQSRRFESTRRGTRLLHELGDELREARLRAGLTQTAVATSLGTTRRRVGWIESGRVGSLSLTDVVAQAGLVGLRLHARFYPAGPPIRDAAQVALMDRFRRRLAPDWQLRLEAPLPIQRDQRAWDMLLRAGRLTIGIEAITRLRDVQAQVRAAQLKRREAGTQRLVLLVAATHANRRALSAAEALMRADFTVGTRPAMAALAAGRDPGGDALVLL